MEEEAPRIQVRTQACAHCGKPSAFLCACSGRLTFWCRDHALIHLSDMAVVHQMKQIHPEAAPVLLEQYQKKFEAVNQGKKTLLENLYRIDECKGRFSNKINGLISSLEMYKAQVLEELKGKKDKLRLKIEEAIDEAETAFDWNATGLSPLATALINCESGKLQLFQYDDSQLGDLSCPITIRTVYRFTYPVLIETNAEVPMKEGNFSMVLENQGESEVEPKSPELVETQEHFESEQPLEEPNAAGIQEDQSTNQDTPPKERNPFQVRWNMPNKCPPFDQTSDEFGSPFKRDPHKEEIYEEDRLGRQPCPTTEPGDFRPTTFEQGQDTQRKSSSSSQFDWDQMTPSQQSGRTTLDLDFSTFCIQKEEIEGEGRQQLIQEEEAKEVRHLGRQKSHSVTDFDDSSKPIPSEGNQDAPRESSIFSKERRVHRETSEQPGRTLAELYSGSDLRIQEQDSKEETKLCRTRSSSVTSPTLPKYDQKKCPVCNTYQPSNYFGEGLCRYHGFSCYICLKTRLNQTKCPGKECSRVYAPKTRDKIQKFIKKLDKHEGEKQ